MAVITIVGAGMMGSAMSIPASDNSHKVRLVGTPIDRDIISEAQQSGYHKTLKRKLPEGVVCYQIEKLDEALHGADLLICGVSSFGSEWFLHNVLPKIPDTLPVLSVTKGLYKTCAGRLISFPDYFKSHLGRPNLSLNCVGGPCISFELADRNHTEVAFCGEFKEDLEKIKSLLQTEYYHIRTTTDVIGLETAVAMKNAYALGVSLAVGISESTRGEGAQDYNPQAGLFYQATKEMQKIIEFNGGKSEMIAYGAGDLYVTIFGGRTRLIGRLLGQGKSFAEARAILKGVTLESVAIATTVYSALKERGDEGERMLRELPLLVHINELIEGKQLDIPWEDFAN